MLAIDYNQSMKLFVAHDAINMVVTCHHNNNGFVSPFAGDVWDAHIVTYVVYGCTSAYNKI